MRPVRVLIVDDEPLAHEILKKYLAKLPGYELIGTCTNALETWDILSKQAIELLLLDINMPEISGIDFLKTLNNAPKVIFTTAHAEFALESYSFSAIDYLLKPITFERFLKAMNKANDIFFPKNEVSNTMPIPTQTSNTNNTDSSIMFVKSEGKIIKIDLSQLWLIESLKNYIKLWSEQGKIIVYGTMKNFEEQLSHLPHFARVNKSYIVNIKYISEIDGNTIRIKDQEIIIGPTYREEISMLIQKNKF